MIKNKSIWANLSREPAQFKAPVKKMFKEGGKYYIIRDDGSIMSWDEGKQTDPSWQYIDKEIPPEGVPLELPEKVN